ncbi:MAG: hypothetical protein IKV32_03140 [Muribaculaceae bacterium]|nr:hypothetical protein [Muribaculaceae bacterium]
MEKKSYIISIVALVVSIITLILFFFRVSPNSVVDSNTFISVLVAIIAISVTILVGYQIYNVMELKQSISEYDKLKEEMKETKSKIEYISIEQNEGFHIIQSRLYSNSINKIDSLLHCVYAIKYSLSVNHKENGYKWLLEQLEKCMLSITLTSFGSGIKKDYDEKTNELKKILSTEDILIKSHKNYLYIKDKYEELMTKFEIRLTFISNQKNVSLIEIDKPS